MAGVASVALQKVPQVSRRRSSFNMSHYYKTTCSSDILVPVFFQDTVPGDTFFMSQVIFCRFNNLMVPVMDSLEMSLYYFYAPNKLMASNFDRFAGGRESLSDGNNYSLPVITSSPSAVYASVSSGGAEVNKKVLSNFWQQDGMEFHSYAPRHLLNSSGTTLRSSSDVNASHISRLKTSMLDYFTPIKAVGDLNIYNPMNSLSFPTMRNVALTYTITEDSTKDLYGKSCLVKDGVQYNNNGWMIGSLPDYFGLPVGVSFIGIVAIPFLFYYRVCDEWFRDETKFSPIVALDSVADTTGSNSKYLARIFDASAPLDVELQNLYTFTAGSQGRFKFDSLSDYLDSDFSSFGLAPGGMYIASRLPDYFNLATASPTFGELTPIPTSDYSVSGTADASGLGINTTASAVSNGVMQYTMPNSSLASGVFYNVSAGYYPNGLVSTGLTSSGNYYNEDTDGLRYHNGIAVNATSSVSQGTTDLPVSGTASPVNQATIMQLRQAFQLDLYRNILNRCGLRWDEQKKAIYGVDSEDGSLKRTELVGMCSTKFDNIPVVQTGGTTQDSLQGELTANSVALLKGRGFRVSSTDFGCIIGLLLIRIPRPIYQEGMDRYWQRFDKNEWFNPLFERIGDQPIYNYELFNPMTSQNVINTGLVDLYDSGGTGKGLGTITANVNSGVQKIIDERYKVFGYQERYAEYKFHPSHITGMYRSRADYVPVFNQVNSFEPSVSSFSSEGLTFYAPTNTFSYAPLEPQGSLDVWHYGLDFDDEFRELPYSSEIQLLNKKIYTTTDFRYVYSHTPTRLSTAIAKSVSPIKRSMQVQDVHPFKLDCYFKLKGIRPVSVSSVPMLVDHM